MCEFFHMSQSPSKKPKKSSVRHTRAIQRDQTKRPNAAPPDEKVEALLREVIQPATLSQVAHFHQLGLRERTLTLPVMVAFVLSLLWRHIGSVREAVRVLNEEGLLWTGPMPVSPQAVLQRLRSVPPNLFQNILEAAIPFAALGVAAGPPLRFQFSLWKDGLPMDAVPVQGWLEAPTSEGDWPS